MKKPVRILLPFAATALAAITGYLVAQEKEAPPSAPLAIETDSRPIERTGGAQPTSYAPMLADARQSVVSVHTSEVVQYARRSGSRQDEILRQLFGIRPPSSQGQEPLQEQKVPQGVGSGVIISADGYILTNNHVVQDRRGGDADEILVRLSDDTELEAKLIGRDPKTDIAVIKVDATDLPFIKVADSDEIMVGDIVFAIGNPLGVGLTVTSGIISATERSIGIYGNDGYEDFIQTDAAINQGNSGGALVDIEGRLIGINSAIKSTSGGSIGLGFAIPSDLAIQTATQLTETGEVKRGLIGIRMSPLDPQVAEAMGVLGTKGVLIEEVVDGYPAKEAGLSHGDIIIQVNDRRVDDPNDLRLEVSTTSPGDSVSIIALRETKEMTFEVKVADPAGDLIAGNAFVEGVTATTLNNEHRKTYDIPREVSGLLITETAPDSPFARHLQPGQVVLEINRQSIDSLAQAKGLLIDKGNNLLYIYADGRTSYFALRLN
ncbi:MAG: Do family serine endopeptidase [Roseibacillus sp.]